MLLPSDVARLVLGYLQEEGLPATSQAFIQESPNLKEYADHTSGDGTIPACMFSVFGKGLTTILNEYVSNISQESGHEIPVVMTSLWKKLDFTLNQIKSLQNTNAIASSQRTRSRAGIANMARQRSITMASPTAIACTSITETSVIVSPAHTSCSHSTPLRDASLQGRAAAAAGGGAQKQNPDVRLHPPRDLPVQMVISEHKLGPGPLSPGRRKWETPRKRGSPVSVSNGPARFSASTGSSITEPQLEEVVNENFPQLVIQNARDKILGDRLLQEKLAENINKILASDPMPPTSKGPLSTEEADQCIDEILGLQGEIHMSDDAIHDILEQTESDPAFQALYDLFDYNKPRLNDGDPADGDDSSTQQVCLAAAAPPPPPALPLPPAGPVSMLRELPSKGLGFTPKDANSSDVAPTTVKGKVASEHNNCKSGAPLKKTVLGSKGRSSRIEKCSATLLVSHRGHQGASSAEDCGRKDRGRGLNSRGLNSINSNSGNSVASTQPMEVDDPLQNPAATTDVLGTPHASVAESGTKAPQAEAPTSCVSQSASSGGSLQQSCRFQPVFLSPAPVVADNTPSATSLPQSSPSKSETHRLLLPTEPVSPSAAAAAAAAAAALTSDSSKAISTSATTTKAAHTPPLPSSGVESSSATSDKAAADPSIVSLKIIITDNQEEGPPSDPALTRAVSSISGDKIPTIYLTSPVRTPTALALGTPRSGLDETAQAVSGLQNSEIQASPLGGKETPQVQQNYIIQLPLDTDTPTLPGGAASYFLVTEPPNTEGQVLVSAGVPSGQPLPIGQYGGAQSCPQGLSPGPALILPSPAKSMMVPVSVMGPNTQSRVQTVSNQLVPVPKAVAIPPAEAVKSKSPAVAIQWSTAAGTDPQLVSKRVQDSPATAKHKRILSFDSPVDIQLETAKTTVNIASSLNPAAKNSSSSQPVEQTQKDNKSAVVRTRPNILGGNRPKRRVQTVRCSASPEKNLALAKEVSRAALPAQQQQQQNDVEPMEKNSNPKGCDQEKRPNGAKEVSEEGSTSEKMLPDKEGDAKDSDSSLKSGSRKEKEDEGKELPVKPREGRVEKRNPAAQEGLNVTANKENEIEGGTREPQPSTPSLDQCTAQAASNPQAKGSKPPSKTSSLAKQAAEMLHDIQAINSPSPRRAPAANPELSPAVRSQEEAASTASDSVRTPTRHRRAKEGAGEGTPKQLLAPNTPDVPSCSPASEAGSENSINMAAQTLMILSRAAIARTGSPLKDSLRQEGAEKKLSASVKVSKKRKLSSPTSVSPANKDREKRKLQDCFPIDLDVDKFLSSLHYDE